MRNLIELLVYCWWRLWNKLPEKPHDRMRVKFTVFNDCREHKEILALYAPPPMAMVEALSITPATNSVWGIEVCFISIEEARVRGLHHSEADRLARVIADVMVRNESLASIPALVEQYQSSKMCEQWSSSPTPQITDTVIVNNGK